MRINKTHKDKVKDHQWAVSFVRGFLEGQGHVVEETPITRCPYDLLVDGEVRIEVKTRRKKFNGLYQYRLVRLTKEARNAPDLYVLAGWVPNVGWDYGVKRAKDCRGMNMLQCVYAEKAQRPTYALEELPRLIKSFKGRTRRPLIPSCTTDHVLDKVDRREIKRLYASGAYSMRSLGRYFSVTQTRILQIVRGT